MYEVPEVSLEEGQRMLDDAAERHLGMTGDEFIAAWDEDRIPDRCSSRVQQVASLLPFARADRRRVTMAEAVQRIRERYSDALDELGRS